MNSFVEEYIGSNMNHSGEKLHKTKKEKKICYDKNNSRNRCVYTQEKAKGTLKFVEKREDLEKENVEEWAKPPKKK